MWDLFFARFFRTGRRASAVVESGLRPSEIEGGPGGHGDHEGVHHRAEVLLPFGFCLECDACRSRSFHFLCHLYSLLTLYNAVFNTQSSKSIKNKQKFVRNDMETKEIKFVSEVLH